MVPVRFIAESLGATVTWDEQTRIVTVQTDDVAVATVRTIPGQVTSMTDGDTIVVRLESGKEERVRLIGVDTPETPVKSNHLGEKLQTLLENGSVASLSFSKLTPRSVTALGGYSLTYGLRNRQATMKLKAEQRCSMLSSCSKASQMS